MAIFMPTNQKRLTNVSIVRLRKGGKRFEVACYPNKVQAWRDHLESDLDEVLQTQAIFVNVSKGEMAKKEDLEKVFSSSSKSDICKEILKKGELQVTGKERHSNLDALFFDVAKIVNQKCINPATQRAYSVAIIEKAMRACHVKLLPTRSAKQQAAEVIGILQESGQLTLEVTLLHVVLDLTLGERITIATARRVRELVNQEAAEVLSDRLDEECGALTMEFLVEPGTLNEIETRIRDETRGRYQMDISRSDKTISTLGGPEDGKSKEEEEEAETQELANGMSRLAVTEEEAAGSKKGASAKGVKDGDTKEEGGEEKKKRRRRAKKDKESAEAAEAPVKEQAPASDDDWEDDRGRGRRGRRGKKGGQAAKAEEEAEEDNSGKRRKERRKRSGRPAQT